MTQAFSWERYARTTQYLGLLSAAIGAALLVYTAEAEGNQALLAGIGGVFGLMGLALIGAGGRHLDSKLVSS